MPSILILNQDSRKYIPLVSLLLHVPSRALAVFFSKTAFSGCLGRSVIPRLRVVGASRGEGCVRGRGDCGRESVLLREGRISLTSSKGKLNYFGTNARTYLLTVSLRC